MKIDNNLLVKTVHAPERQVTIPCQEIKIDTIDQEIAVRWKNTRHRKRTNEVGDGMEVLRVHERKEIDVKIDPERFLYGLSPRQEYDETQDRVITYLYRFSKDLKDIDTANILIQQVLPNVSVKIEQRFVILEGGSKDFLKPVDLGETLDNAGISTKMSLLGGLIVAYGKFTLEGNIVHNCTIRFPLTGPAAQRATRIQEAILALRTEGVYVSQTILSQKEGQSLQINISDREFLHTISQLLRIIYGNIEVSKFNLYQQQKQLLLTFLSEHNAPAEVVSKIEDSVLKTVRK